MQLLIDLATMAVMHSSGVPLTDLALVRGDKLPLRITLLDDGVPVTPSGVRPALAIKTALGDGTLVLAATDLEPVDDALGVAYVGSLSVNTTQLAEAMGQEDRMELVGELVLISGDGSQRTSSLIRVSVRQDILPAEYAPPAEVLANWDEMVAASLAAQLPDALHKAGMYVTPQGGTTTLATNMTPSHRRDVTYYRLPLNHRNIVGHLADSYTINSITLRANQSAVPVYVEVYKLVNGSYALLGRSINAIAPANANQDYAWEFRAGMSVRRDDTIILRVVREDGVDAVLALAITQVAASNPESGADIVDGLVNPQRVINPAYPDIRYLLYVRIGVVYTDGVSVGGVELATKDDFNVLTQDVVTTGEQVHHDAQSASDAATAAQQALAAMPVDAAGNITAQGATFARTVNANGGVNIPLTATPSAQTHAVNRVLAGGIAVVADACNPQVFLSSRTTYGASVSVMDVVPGFLWQLKNSASSSSPVNGTVRVGFDSTLVGRSNYGTIWGYVIPYRPASSKHKVTFTTGMYREGECVISTEQPIDTFTVSPKPSNKSSWLRIIDITFYDKMDSSSVPVGYPVRVREMVYNKSNDKWVIYTTMSVISAFNTQVNNAQAIVYQQDPDDTGCQSGLWLIVQGAAGQRTLRLADLHGVPDSYGWDTMSPVWWDAGYGSAHIGAPRVTQVYSPDRVNGAYHAFTAIESRQIQSTSSADFNCYE